ncbi:hypothetical protein GH733_018363 [Mirounga leonina]|nr:hypothetical protein GH733_018363 [Mirounga leonina]
MKSALALWGENSHYKTVRSHLCIIHWLPIWYHATQNAEKQTRQQMTVYTARVCEPANIPHITHEVMRRGLSTLPCGLPRTRLAADCSRPSPATILGFQALQPASASNPSLHCSRARLPVRRNHLRRRGLRQLSRQSPPTLAFFVIRCIGSPACPIVSDAAVDTSSEITTKDLKEKKEVVEEAENGRDAPANGNANEENGEQEADNEVDEEGGEGEEEEEEGDGEEEDGDEDEEAEAATGKRAAEDDEDDDVDTKKQKTDEDD